MLKILQLNAGRAYLAMCEVSQVMRELGCRIALIQEPYADVSGRIQGLPNTMQVYANRNASAAVLIDDSSIQCVVYSGLGDQGIAVRCEGTFGVLIVTSVYCRFGCPLDEYLEFLDRVLPLAGRSPIIIAMDANASSPIWFSKSLTHTRGHENRIRGEVLGEWLTEKALHVANEPSEWYTFDGPNGVSDIDVTVVNARTLRKFQTQWRVLDGYSISDHNPIVFSLTPLTVRRNLRENNLRWRSRRVDWLHYTEELCAEAVTHCPIEEFGEMQLSLKLHHLMGLMRSVNDRVLGRAPRRHVGTKVAWWNLELTRKRQEVIRMRRRYQRARRGGNPETIAARKEGLRVLLLEYKRLIRDQKNLHWSNFVRRNSADPWGQVYKLCRRSGTGNSDISRIKDGDRVRHTWRGCIRVLLRHFFPQPSMFGETFGPENQPVELDHAEVIVAVSKLRSSAAPGFDGITGAMVKAMWTAIPSHMLELYSHCVRDGHFPVEWKLAKTVVLLKSPDKDKSIPGSYRGICLLSAMGKVLEHIMIERLMEKLGGGFSQFQFGFQQRKSTEDALVYVQNCVESSTERYVLGIFVDFKGAFDNLEWLAIIRRLQDVGCTEMELWKHYFSGRRARAVTVSQSVEMAVTRGCPQGSIIGPFVWNLMMDVLLLELQEKCKFCAYADDLLLLVEGRSRSELESKAIELMEITRTWGLSAGVEVSAEKTVAMLLRGKLSRDRPPTIRYSGGLVKYMTEVKYLGVTIGERLNFSPHLKELNSKMQRTVAKLQRVLRVKGGLTRRSVRTIYKGLFVACATYGSAVWYGRCSTSMFKTWLARCQRIPLLSSLAVCRSVSTDAMQVLAGAIPWDLEAKRHAIAYKMRKGIPLFPTDWMYGVDIGSMPKEERSARLLQCALDEWQSRWERSEKGRTTFRFIPNVSFTYNDPDFSFGLRVGFLLTGHGSLGSFLRDRALSPDASCVCGEPEENWLHVLCCCPLYEDIRDLGVLGVIYDAENPHLTDVSPALATPERQHHLELFATEAFSRRYMLHDAD